MCWQRASLTCKAMHVKDSAEPPRALILGREYVQAEIQEAGKSLSMRSNEVQRLQAALAASHSETATLKSQLANLADRAADTDRRLSQEVDRVFSHYDMWSMLSAMAL